MSITKMLRDAERTDRVMSQTHPTEPLTIWNYTIQTQYERDWTALTRMARGLVTDDKDNIVARPYGKFFNLNERPFRWSDNHRIFEKMDGSLGIVFYYNGEWHISTRGSFTSDQSVKGAEMLKEYDLSELDPEYTYMFEIIYPENRIVVSYDEERLTMIGKRHTESGRIVDIDDYRTKGFDVVKEYTDLSFEELTEIEWDNKEGFVVRFIHNDGMDDDFVKIKFDEYCRLHKIMTEVSTKSVWEMLKGGKDMEQVLQNVPDEFYNKIREYESELQSEFNELDTGYRVLYHQAVKGGYTDDRKKFAEYAKSVTDNPAPLFKMLDDREYESIIWDMIQPDYRPL